MAPRKGIATGSLLAVGNKELFELAVKECLPLSMRMMNAAPLQFKGD